MATKKENLQHQLKSALYKQFYDAKGMSRHEHKKVTGEYAHHNRIYSRQSLKTHLSRAQQFGKWLKETHPAVKRLDDISRDVVGEYLQHQQELGYSTRTIEADLTMVNHVQVGRGAWDRQERLTKREFNLASRSKAAITNNRGETRSQINYNDRHQEAIRFGQAFGLRRSELVPNRENTRYAVAQNSLYEKDGRLYVATIGKGGRFRTAECLENRQDAIREDYGPHIQQVEQLPTKEQFLDSYDRDRQLFDSISNNVRIHVECRQYYANEKLNELEASGRHFQLHAKSLTKTGYDKYTTNGRTMDRDHAQFVSHQLGHNRIYELSSYINVNPA